jgi:hypothetical protein
MVLFLFMFPFSLLATPSRETITQNAIKIDRLDKLPSKLSSLLTPFNVILIGETHGTKESPAFSPEFDS